MKILHIITDLVALGGVPNHLLSLVKAQAKRGHTIDILYLKDETPLTENFRAAGARMIDKVPFDRISQGFTCIWEIRNRIRTSPPDVIHTHLPKANLIGGIAARLARSAAPVIGSKHNDDHQLKNPLTGLVHGLISLTCEDKVICISDHVKRYYGKKGFVPDSKMTRVYYGFDQDIYQSPAEGKIRSQFGVSDQSCLFACIGRLTPQKNQKLLVEAIEHLRKRRTDFHVLLVGADGYTSQYREEVEAQIEEYGLQKFVTLTGWRDDILAILKDSDCMVLPSAWEGLGMVFIESLAVGTPVIASSISAIPEVVRDGIDGILIPSGDRPALVRAMEELMENREIWRERVAGSSPARIKEMFGVDRMADEIESIYNLAKSG